MDVKRKKSAKLNRKCVRREKGKKANKCKQDKNANLQHYVHMLSGCSSECIKHAHTRTEVPADGNILFVTVSAIHTTTTTAMKLEK